MNVKIDGEVKQHTYPAHVTEIFLELPRDAFRDLENQLAEASGRQNDNHVVYEVKQEIWSSDGPQENITYISCSDYTVSFGRGIREQW